MAGPERQTPEDPMPPMTDAQVVDMIGSLAFLAVCIGAVVYLFFSK